MDKFVLILFVVLGVLVLVLGCVLVTGMMNDMEKWDENETAAAAGEQEHPTAEPSEATVTEPSGDTQPTQTTEAAQATEATEVTEAAQATEPTQSTQPAETQPTVPPETEPEEGLDPSIGLELPDETTGGETQTPTTGEIEPSPSTGEDPKEPTVGKDEEGNFVLDLEDFFS